MKRTDHIANALEAIDKGLEAVGEFKPEPSLDEQWDFRLQALHDFEDLAWAYVAKGKITASDAENAITDFTLFIEGVDNPYVM